ncbi:MAG: hypothetical protein LBF86_08665 [Helicobacteraceae bacterium]|jgi:hypothetical protein|nr:hypothetical protein [Helicobacteraceae bacterium]
MTISIDENRVKRATLYIVWALVCAALLFAGIKYLPSIILSKAPAFAIIKTSDLIQEEKERLIKDGFVLYQSQTDATIEQAAKDYFERVKRIAALIAKEENLIIFDDGAVIGAPVESVVDITPFVRRELEKAKNATR